MARFVYRLGQFWRGLWATITPEDRQCAASVLPPAALPLFAAMPVDAQRHSLNVLFTLWAAGQRHPDLAIAALLHDCGKVAAAQGGVKIGVWRRGPLVLLNNFFPRMAARWATPNPGSNPVQGWRYALYVQREHPAIVTAWAAQAGCITLSCWLIAHHQSPLGVVEGSDEARTLLMALQHADNGN